MFKGSPMLRSALLLTLANLAMRGVSMLFQAYLTGQVGAAGVGLLQLILTVNAFAVTVGTSGIRVAAMYLSAEEYGLRRYHGIRQAMYRCLGSGLLLSTFVGLLMAFFAESLAHYWVKDLQAVFSLRLLGLTLPLTCLSAILAGYFTACGLVRQLVIVEILDRIASVGLTVWLLNRGVPGDLSHACASIVGGSALASVGSVAVLFGIMRANFRTVPDIQESLQMGRRLWQLCVPIALNDYLRSGLGTIEQFLIPYGLTRSGGSRTQALADYGTIHGMVFPLMMLPSTVLFSLADLLVPELARCRAVCNQRRLQRMIRRCLSASVLYAAAVGGLLFVLAQPLGMLIYRSPQASHYLRLFAPLVPILYLDCIVDGIHKGLGQQIYCVRVNTLTNLLDVVFLFLLLPRYGIGGYYFTYVFTHVINFYLSIHRLLQITHAAPYRKFLALSVSCVLLSVGISAAFLPKVPRWSSVCFAAGIYLTLLSLLLILTGCIDKSQSSP